MSGITRADFLGSSLTPAGLLELGLNPGLATFLVAGVVARERAQRRRRPDGSVRAAGSRRTFLAQVAGQHGQVGYAHDVVHATDVLGMASGCSRAAALAGRVEPGRAHRAGLGDASRLGNRRGVRLDRGLAPSKLFGALINERLVLETFLGDMRTSRGGGCCPGLCCSQMLAFREFNTAGRNTISFHPSE